jgi:hypothetical protein
MNDKIEWLNGRVDYALTADGFDDAIIGVGERCGQPPLVCYDSRKCIEILMERDGMEYEEAVEFFQFNTLGSWVGESTPMFIDLY